uniref:SGNH hydrolase-type esterase domain-containing protein n=1 Tax=Oncorhynchus tshawytscha TaxID=74940 RepID=A0AAZ3QIA8_ONCTS
MVRQDLQQPKLRSDINMMPSNSSRCTRNIQENDHLTARIALVSTPKAPIIGSDKLKTLVIGDSITHSFRFKTTHPAIIHCLPGGRAIDVKANLRMVPAKAKTGKCREYRDIIIHVGTNDIRMKPSEVTKRNIASACKSAKNMCRHRVIVSGPLPVRGSDELYSSLTTQSLIENCFLPLPKDRICR